jgi:hypothetical protein
MWGQHPKHAMQFFNAMPTLEIGDNIQGLMKKNIKRKPKDILSRKLKRPTNLTTI